MPRPSRQMHGRRALAAAAAAALLISLFAPWYRDSVVARGLTGLRTMTLTRSGWDAFSFTEGLVLVVAVVALALVAAIPLRVRDQGGWRRWLGALVAALGALAFVVVLVRLATAPGTTRHALDATMVSVRWGMFLALGASAALAVAGLRLIRVQAADAVGSARGSQPARPARSERRGRSDRTARASRPNLVPRPTRPPSSERVTPRSERVAPRAVPRTERPARRADRALWEEQATGWLDLGD